MGALAPAEQPAAGSAEPAARKRDSIPVLDVVLDPAAPSEPPGPGPRRRLSPTQLALGGIALGLLAIGAIFALVIGIDQVRREGIARAFFGPRGAVATRAADKEAPSDRASPIDSASPPGGARPEPSMPVPFRIHQLASAGNVKLVEGAIDRRTFIGALAESGIPQNQIYRLLSAFKGIHDFGKPKRRDNFVAALDPPSRRVRAFEYAVSSTEIYQAREGEDGSLSAGLLDLHVEKRRALAAIVLGDDMQKSVEAAGLDRSIVDWLDEALESRAQLTPLRHGARLRVIADYETALGSFARYVDVPAIEYLPADPEVPPLRVYRFREQNTPGYFDSSWRQPYKGGFRTPVPLARITSRFNMKRMHPILHVVMPHNGVDFAAAPGTPVYAAAPGNVEWIGDGGASGNLVTIRHPGDITTGYAHLSRFAAHLAKGQAVEARQLIGYVGSTGRSTGPHLHFSVRKNGAFIDPLRLRLDGERVLPKSARPDFDKGRVPLDELLDAIGLPDPAAVSPPESEDLEPLDEPDRDL